MAENFRTTVSAVYWTETTDEAEATAEAMTATLSDVDAPNTLVTIEYKSEGRPEPPPEAAPGEATDDPEPGEPEP
jgi:hypothetical protein